MKRCPKCQKQFSDDANFCPVDAARLVPLEGAAAAADPVAARFELGPPLGGARTGQVVRATDKTTGAAAAVKVIAPAVVALPTLAQRLERELKQLERVQSAGVAKVLGSGKRGDDTWVALELVDGAVTLAEAISARGPIPADQAAHLIEVIGEALIEAAQVGVVHRDLAPKNVLLAGDELKLINFSLPVPPTGDGKVPGVADFVAPEQQDGKAVDQRSNLYSLGALYYYVLTGATVQLDDAGAVRPPSAVVGSPAAVDAVILRALDRSPTKRFLTVRQFVDEVGRIARGEAAPVAVGRKPKAEVVQTLLGIRGGADRAIAQAIAAAARPADPAGASSSSAPGSERSPWAAPQGHPVMSEAEPGAALAVAAQIGASPMPPSSAAVTTPMAAAPAPAPAPAPTPAPAVAPAPVPAAPVVPPPVLAAPILAPAAGKKAGKPGGDGKDAAEDKGKFRETMWFKKGELDAQAAQAAAEERAKTGRDASADQADSLPIDERYKDDGSLSRSDKEKYSLRTGGTMMTAAVADPGTSSPKVSEDALIGEMKGGRTRVFVLIAAGVIAVGALIALLVS